MTRHPVGTNARTEFLDITAVVKQAVATSGVTAGTCVVYCPHTTAAVTIQENADPDVPRDILMWLNRLVPKDVPGFKHAEGNSDAHLKASLVGSSVTLLIENGGPALGTWQGVFFCEFDGPRDREVWVHVAG
jgi:secondary thiamine-phosphate synthase enzyme